jgi:cation transport regulator ChaC
MTRREYTITNQQQEEDDDIELEQQKQQHTQIHKKDRPEEQIRSQEKTKGIASIYQGVVQLLPSNPPSQFESA